MKEEQLKIRPYARLLTMLGDQLIKNERIALIELIKNSYDADASWVKVIFENFEEDFKKKENARIIVEDSGTGMTLDVIRNHFLNPATPEKKLKKEQGKGVTPLKGRTIQGEKGIGRFAMFKLGRKITIETRPKGGNEEYTIIYDFSEYDDEFLSYRDERKELYLDDLTVHLEVKSPQHFINGEELVGVREIQKLGYGTRLIIEDLKGDWSATKVDEVYRDISRLSPIFERILNPNSKLQAAEDFDVYIFNDEKLLPLDTVQYNNLQYLLEEQSVLKITNGRFDDTEKKFYYDENGIPKQLELESPYVTALLPFSRVFGKGKENVLRHRKVESGSFTFDFYIFDFSNKAPAKYKLKQEDKKLLREHRIYLYRDGIRVYPYGDPEDDWLQIDAYRGTVSAGDFLSNDQVVGSIGITATGNPALKDKTNREGLLEEGNAVRDFIGLIQSFLAYIRRKPYQLYQDSLETKKRQDIYKEELVIEKLKEIDNYADNPEMVKSLSEEARQLYNSEKAYLVRRAETTEMLASVGLSVEVASHDLTAMLTKVLINLDSLMNQLSSGNPVKYKAIEESLMIMRGGLTFVMDQMKDIQLLFRSSKQRRRLIRVQESLDKVIGIYKRVFHKSNVSYEVRHEGRPLVVRTIDAVLLQLFLNLMDNAIFWMDEMSEIAEKKIVILLDGDSNQIIFADSGPGVQEEDIPYIFEPFFSGKGEEGRGLGLYIAKQLLEKNDATIELILKPNEKLLRGANFLIKFGEK